MIEVSCRFRSRLWGCLFGLWLSHACDASGLGTCIFWSSTEPRAIWLGENYQNGSVLSSGPCLIKHSLPWARKLRHAKRLILVLTWELIIDEGPTAENHPCSGESHPAAKSLRHVEC